MFSDFMIENFLLRHYENIIDSKKYKKFSFYLKKIEKVHRISNTGHKKELLYEMYYNKYVIKEENIMNHMDKDMIIESQKNSLKKWIVFLNDFKYPFWVKYWIFQGVVRLGPYSETSESYLRRNKNTFCDFIDINSEVLIKCAETIMRIVNEELEDSALDEEERMLSKCDSFKSIYTFYEKRYKAIKKERTSINGIWKKYRQGNKNDALLLCSTIKNKKTGWCTINENTAIKQLCGSYIGAVNGGDFYVYYSSDENGNYTIPRIALRLIDDNKIAEIRGVKQDQNVEEELIDILMKKISEIPNINPRNIEKQIGVMNDLNNLALIERKIDKNIELSDKEIYDLYTKDYKFGIEQESRLRRIWNKRDVLKDYSKIDDEFFKKRVILKCYEFFPNNSILDKEICYHIVSLDGNNIKFVNSKIDIYEELCFMAIRKKSIAIKYIDKSVNNYSSICMESVRINGYALKYISLDTDNYFNICIEAVKSDGLALEFVDVNIDNYNEICIEAIKEDFSAITYVSKNCSKYKEIYDFAVNEYSEKAKKLSLKREK